MKNLVLMLIAMLCFAFTADAQYVTRKSDSADTETKYMYFLNTKRNTTAFQLTAVKASGTVAGTVTLERRIDTLPTAATSVWVQVGSTSFTLTDVATPQGTIFPVELHDGLSYRIKVVATTGKVYLYGSYLRW